ncbi:MAG: imidazole glycerol phosphate synthase subunit HisF [Candidatus Omnitrophica bacterium]|nr:imidazole glycerol phosphate synthase subunit HisF [Candidatus Omnitrophota bacterium]
MRNVRIIPRLDIKGPNVIKGIQLEGLRIVGKPYDLARRYYNEGADELIYMDVVASLYNRNNLAHIVEETTEKDVFIPITVGGGLRTIEDINNILRSGADKVAINTAAVKDPGFLKLAVETFGSSTIVLSVEAKKIFPGKWEAYVDNGRQRTGLDVVEWVKKAESLGVGEILVTSVDNEGTRQGYDIDLINVVSEVVSVPVIASGGVGNVKHMEKCMLNKRVDGMAVASILHYGDSKVGELKSELLKVFGQRIKHGAWDDVEIGQETFDCEVSIVDYNCGNLRSVKNAFKQFGARPKLINTIEEILNAEFLVLPGVGAFETGMKNLKAKGLDRAILEYARQGKPLLGICLGMQLLMEKSYEFGTYDGLGIIAGDVVKFDLKQDLIKDGYKVPHVGWNSISQAKGWEGSILASLPNNCDTYFVHSYFVRPDNKEDILATTNYFGNIFCSAIQRDNIFGCQFHPEKSGKAGLLILKEFLKISNKREVVNV